jgi:hypothetical protein
MRDYCRVYQSLGALDECRQYSREIGIEYCIEVLRRGSKANRVEVRRAAESYLKEFQSQMLQICMLAWSLTSYASSQNHPTNIPLTCSSYLSRAYASHMSYTPDTLSLWV